MLIPFIHTPPDDVTKLCGCVHHPSAPNAHFPVWISNPDFQPRSTLYTHTLNRSPWLMFQTEGSNFPAPRLLFLLCSLSRWKALLNTWESSSTLPDTIINIPWLSPLLHPWLAVSSPLPTLLYYPNLVFLPWIYSPWLNLSVVPIAHWNKLSPSRQQRRPFSLISTFPPLNSHSTNIRILAFYTLTAPRPQVSFMISPVSEMPMSLLCLANY